MTVKGHIPVDLLNKIKYNDLARLEHDMKRCSMVLHQLEQDFYYVEEWHETLRSVSKMTFEVIATNQQYNPELSGDK